MSFPSLLSGDADSFCERLRTGHETSKAPGSLFGAPEHFRIGHGCAAGTLAGGPVRIGAALDRGGTA